MVKIRWSRTRILDPNGDDFLTRHDFVFCFGSIVVECKTGRLDDDGTCVASKTRCFDYRESDERVNDGRSRHLTWALKN